MRGLISTSKKRRQTYQSPHNSSLFSDFMDSEDLLATIPDQVVIGSCRKGVKDLGGDGFLDLEDFLHLRSRLSGQKEMICM